MSFVDEDLSGRTIGEYEIKAKLGRGGMGVVYRALLRGDVDIPVAIKYPIFDERKPHAADRFIREMEVLSLLSDPRIVSIRAAGTHTIDGVDRPYYVMPFIHGVTLHKLLADHGAALPLNVAAHVFLQKLLALQYLHHTAMRANKPLRVVHRDLSPDNIMIQLPLGSVQLTDFGVSSTVTERSVIPSMVGKIRYMAPESIDHDEPTTKVDIWAAAAIGWELLHGRMFLGGLRSEAQVLTAIRDGKLPAFEDHVPTRFASLLASMLSAEPEARPSAPEAISLLVDLCEELGINLERARIAFSELIQEHYGSTSTSGKTEAYQAAVRSAAKLRAEQLIGQPNKRSTPTVTIPPHELLAKIDESSIAEAEAIKAKITKRVRAELDEECDPDTPEPKPIDKAEAKPTPTFELVPTVVRPRTIPKREQVPTVIRPRKRPEQPGEFITPSQRDEAAISGEVEGDTRRNRAVQNAAVCAPLPNDETPRPDPRELFFPTVPTTEVLPPPQHPGRTTPPTQPNRDTPPEILTVPPRDTPRVARAPQPRSTPDPLMVFALCILALASVVLGYVLA